MQIKKSRICAMRIHGRFVAALVLEIGQKQITVYNMDTNRICHLPVKQPKAKKVVASPIAIETTDKMNSIMETDVLVKTVMDTINGIM